MALILCILIGLGALAAAGIYIFSDGKWKQAFFVLWISMAIIALIAPMRIGRVIHLQFLFAVFVLLTSWPVAMLLVAALMIGRKFLLRRYKSRVYPWQTIDHCPNCGYDLKGNRTGFCPECGEHIKARVPGTQGDGTQYPEVQAPSVPNASVSQAPDANIEQSIQPSLEPDPADPAKPADPADRHDDFNDRNL